MMSEVRCPNKIAFSASRTWEHPLSTCPAAPVIPTGSPSRSRRSFSTGSTPSNWTDFFDRWIYTGKRFTKIVPGRRNGSWMISRSGRGTPDACLNWGARDPTPARTVRCENGTAGFHGASRRGSLGATDDLEKTGSLGFTIGRFGKSSLLETVRLGRAAPRTILRPKKEAPALVVSF